MSCPLGSIFVGPGHSARRPGGDPTNQAGALQKILRGGGICTNGAYCIGGGVVAGHPPTVRVSSSSLALSSRRKHQKCFLPLCSRIMSMPFFEKKKIHVSSLWEGLRIARWRHPPIPIPRLVFLTALETAPRSW